MEPSRRTSSTEQTSSRDSRLVSVGSGLYGLGFCGWVVCLIVVLVLFPGTWRAAAARELPTVASAILLGVTGVGAVGALLIVLGKAMQWLRGESNGSSPPIQTDGSAES